MTFIFQQAKLPFLICGCAAIILALEAIQHGWQDSAARRLWIHARPTERADLFWFAVTVTGLVRLAAFAITLGATWWLPILIGWTPPLCEWPLILQFLFAAAASEFVFYWTHRGLHRWAWFAHRTHHESEAFNAITVFRTHPFEVALTGPLISLPAAIAGINPSVILSWFVVRHVHDMLVHSELLWLPRWMSEWVIMDGRQHAQHHSCEPSDYNCKFATVPIFDRLFGTWKPLPEGKIKIGIKNDEYK